MKNAIEMNAITGMATETTHFFKRFAVLSYGLLAYAIGCTGLFWLILGVGGIAPVGLGAAESVSLSTALGINAGLILLFGLQHSIMARRGFKQWLTRMIPEAAERASYMLMSGIVTMIAVYYWQPVEGVVWQVENSVLQVAIWCAYAFGAVYLLLATLVTNHFELMGLRQVYLYFRNKPYTALPFTRKFMYRYSRHPMMLGMLMLLWANPNMSVSHFVLAGLFTVYMAVGMFFEERDLIKQFGDTYRKYKKEIATFIPRMY